MKLYAELWIPDNEDVIKLLLKIASEKELFKKTCNNKDEYKEFIVALHKDVREMFNLPNKLLGIVRNKENTKAFFALFDKEPDGNDYDIFPEKHKKGLNFILKWRIK